LWEQRSFLTLWQYDQEITLHVMSHFFVEISTNLNTEDSGNVDFPFKKVTWHVIFLKKKIWSCCFTFWYFDNKSRKSRIRPWHIFERVFNGFRTFIIRNYWKISISPVSDSDTLWNRYFLTSIIAIRGTECRFNNW